MPSTVKRKEERKRRRRALARGEPDPNPELDTEKPPEASVPEPEEAEKTDDNAVAPQLKVDEHGNIVIDQTSLIISAATAGAGDAPNSAVTSFENYQHTRHITSATFSKRESSTKWEMPETERFFEALQKFGCDFSLIEASFQGRSRRQLKLKFKREERENPDCVDAALAGTFVSTMLDVAAVVEQTATARRGRARGRGRRRGRGRGRGRARQQEEADPANLQPIPAEPVKEGVVQEGADVAVVDTGANVVTDVVQVVNGNAQVVVGDSAVVASSKPAEKDGAAPIVTPDVVMSGPPAEKDGAAPIVVPDVVLVAGTLEKTAAKEVVAGTDAGTTVCETETMDVSGTAKEAEEGAGAEKVANGETPDVIAVPLDGGLSVVGAEKEKNTGATAEGRSNTAENGRSGGPIEVVLGKLPEDGADDEVGGGGMYDDGSDSWGESDGSAY